MGSTQKSYANALRSRNEGQRAQTNPLPRESGISLGSNERRHVNQVPRKDQIIANLKTELPTDYKKTQGRDCVPERQFSESDGKTKSEIPNTAC